MWQGREGKCATKTTSGHCIEERKQDGVKTCHEGATRTKRARE